MCDKKTSEEIAVVAAIRGAVVGNDDEALYILARRILNSSKPPSDTNKAIQVETSVEGLQITVGRDGVWLHFKADGKHASLNMNCVAEDKGRIIGSAIGGWCAEVRKRYAGRNNIPV